jgi:predicted RNA-binding protein YlxR (DUF448 family)
MAGRGAYVHDRYACWEIGLEGALAHALKINITNEEMEHLLTFAKTLTDADS